MTKKYRVCRYCVLRRGIRGSELAERHLETDEDLYNHIEEFHGIPVVREGETERQAIDRCTKKGIVADRNKCRCSECEELRKNDIYYFNKDEILPSQLKGKFLADAMREVREMRRKNDNNNG